MEVNGLPLHPLVVHAAVVLSPIAALATILYAIAPKWRDRLRWPVFVLAIVATGSILAAYFSGENFLDSRPEFAQNPTVQEHEDYAEKLYWTGIGFGMVTVVATLLHGRSGLVTGLLRVLAALAAVGVIVLVFLTGEEGARAVWG